MTCSSKSRSNDRRFISNKVIKIASWGEISMLAGPGICGTGAVGLTTDPRGNVYAAFASLNENHGVWNSRSGRYTETWQIAWYRQW